MILERERQKREREEAAKREALAKRKNSRRSQRKHRSLSLLQNLRLKWERQSKALKDTHISRQ